MGMLEILNNYVQFMNEGGCMVRNNYMTTVRCRIEDFVGVGEYLRNNGIVALDKGRIFVEGIKILSTMIPKGYSCNNTFDAYLRLEAMGYNGGVEKKNDNYKTLLKQLEKAKLIYLEERRYR